MSERRFGIRAWQRLADFYPPRTKPREMLGLYAQAATVVETDNTFAGIPKPERIAEWAAHAPAGFKFDVVAFGGLTLYQRRPGDSGPVTRKSWREVAVEPPDVLFDDFKASIQPLVDAQLLGCVILQFPPWFEAGEASRAYLTRVRERLDGLPVAAEFRHPTWQVPSERDRMLEHLIELEIGLVVADFPEQHPEWVPPIMSATVEDLAVVRLHGRNADRWPRTVMAPVEAMPYEYTDEDLAPWVGRVRELGNDVAEVHVLVGTAPPDDALAVAQRLRAAIEEAEEAEARWGYAPAAGR